MTVSEQPTRDRHFSRRAFVRLVAAAGSTAVVANQLGWLGSAEATTSPELRPFLIAATPAKSGSFSEEYLRQKAAATAYERNPRLEAAYLDTNNCWADIWALVYEIPAERRRADLHSIFEGFVHGVVIFASRECQACKRLVRDLGEGSLPVRVLVAYDQFPEPVPSPANGVEFAEMSEGDTMVRYKARVTPFAFGLDPAFRVRSRGLVNTRAQVLYHGEQAGSSGVVFHFPSDEARAQGESVTG